VHTKRWSSHPLRWIRKPLAECFPSHVAPQSYSKNQATFVEVSKPTSKPQRPNGPIPINAVAQFRHETDAQALIAKINGMKIPYKGADLRVEAHAEKAVDYFQLKAKWEKCYYGIMKGGTKRKAEGEVRNDGPDTLTLSGLPSRWFAEISAASSSEGTPGNGKPPSTTAPSSRILRTVFSKFGRIRRVEILSPRSVPDTANSLDSLLSLDTDFNDLLSFSVHVQYFDHDSFCRAMCAFFGRALHQTGASFICHYTLDFDRDAAVQGSSHRAYIQPESTADVTNDKVSGETSNGSKGTTTPTTTTATPSESEALSKTESDLKTRISISPLSRSKGPRNNRRVRFSLGAPTVFLYNNH